MSIGLSQIFKKTSTLHGQTVEWHEPLRDFILIKAGRYKDNRQPDLHDGGSSRDGIQFFFSSLLSYVIFYILSASSLSYFFCHHCSSLSVICHNQVIRKEHPNSQHAYATNLILDYGRIVDQEPKHPFDPLCSSWKATDQRQLSNNPETSCSYFAVEPSIHR